MINFVQTVPDSQWFSDLEQILNYSIEKKDKYLETAIKNSINKGYNLGLFNVVISGEPVNRISFNDLKKLLEGNVTIDIENFIKELKKYKKEKINEN